MKEYFKQSSNHHSGNCIAFVQNLVSKQGKWCKTSSNQFLLHISVEDQMYTNRRHLQREVTHTTSIRVARVLMPNWTSCGKRLQGEKARLQVIVG